MPAVAPPPACADARTLLPEVDGDADEQTVTLRVMGARGLPKKRFGKADACVFYFIVLFLRMVRTPHRQRGARW